MIPASRCLEGEASRSSASSLDAYVEAQRRRCPSLVAWATVSIFCGLHVIIPAYLTGLFFLILTCQHGRVMMERVEEVLRPLLEMRLFSQIPVEELVEETKEFVSCPESGSMLCTVCTVMHPGLVGSLLALVLFLLTFWPVRPWPSVANLFQYWWDIFSFKVVLDQTQFAGLKPPFLLVGVPHGVIPLGCFLAMTYVRLFLPVLDGTYAAASVLFRLPLFRQFFTWIGARPAEKKTIEQALLEEKRNVYILSGGIAEIFLSNRKREELFLRRRRGFVKMAIKTGVPLVPIYIFGQTRLFDQLAGSEGFAMALSRKLKSSITVFWGRWFLPIPHAARIRVVLGAPILISEEDKRTMAMEDLVSKTHDRFVQAITDLYNAHKDEAGYADIPLVVK